MMGACTSHISKGLSAVDHFIISSPFLASVRLRSVAWNPSDHCQLMLMLHLQAETLACAQALGAQIKIKGVNAEDSVQSREGGTLIHLLHPVLISPGHSCWFVTALQLFVA